MSKIDVNALAALTPEEQVKAVAEFIASLPADRMKSLVIGTKVTEKDGEHNRYTCFWIGGMPDAGQIIEVFAKAYAQTVKEMVRNEEQEAPTPEPTHDLPKHLH